MQKSEMSNTRRIVKKVKGSYGTYVLVERSKDWTVGDLLFIIAIGMVFFTVSLV